MTPVPLIRAFFDEATNTVSYLVADPVAGDAAVIDPVLDYDHATGEVNARSVEAILASAGDAGWRIVRTLETHAHADHLSGSPLIKGRTSARIGIGVHIKEVQRIFPAGVRRHGHGGRRRRFRRSVRRWRTLSRRRS